jgi:nucleotide-binding universal stress UspA family protein
VLLVRTPPTEAALQRKSLVKRILVPLDGSRVGEAAVPCTVTLARVFGAELVLFHVVEQLPEPAVSRIYRLGSEMSLEINKRRRELATAYLNGTARSLEKQGLKVATAMTTWTESTADQIIDYAEANAIDLIGMSTHGRSGVGRWVFGSVTDKVLHAGSLPVLVVRPGKEPYPA